MDVSRGKLWGASLLLAACTIVSANPVPAPFGPVWSIDREFAVQYFPDKFGSTAVWTLRRTASPEEHVSFTFSLMKKETTRTSVESVNRMGPTRSVFADGLCDGAIAVANGQFFLDRRNKKTPLGLLIVDGKTISEVSRRKSGGFLAIDPEGHVSIMSRGHAKAAQLASQALESTPILVRDGRSDMRGDDHVKFDRVAIGTSTDGSTILVGAFGEDQQTLSLAEFANLALAAARVKRVSIESLLAMDGGPSAHLWYPRANLLMGGRGPVYLPSAVCVRPK